MLAAVLALSAALAAPGALAGTPLSEQGVDVGALAERLRSDPVLVDERSVIRPDVETLRNAFADLPVPTYAVVLPQEVVDTEESGIDGVLLRLLDALDDPRAVVVVVSDEGELQAGEGGASGVPASAALDRIVQARSDQEFNGTALTGALLAFSDVVAQEGEEGGRRGITSSGRRAIGVAGLVAVAVLAAGLLWSRAQRRARNQAPLTDDEAVGGRW
jgi:hypothetical protein